MKISCSVTYNLWFSFLLFLSFFLRLKSGNNKLYKFAWKNAWLHIEKSLSVSVSLCLPLHLCLCVCPSLSVMCICVCKCVLCGMHANVCIWMHVCINVCTSACACVCACMWRMKDEGWGWVSFSITFIFTHCSRVSHTELTKSVV